MYGTTDYEKHHATGGRKFNHSHCRQYGDVIWLKTEFDLFFGGFR